MAGCPFSGWMMTPDIQVTKVGALDRQSVPRQRHGRS